MKKIIAIMMVCLLMTSGCSQKKFERGSVSGQTYNNSYLGLKITYPSDWVISGRDSIAFQYGCQLVEGEDWQTTFDKCKKENNTNYFWDFSMESNEGKNFSGLLVEDISTRNALPTVEDLIQEQMDAAKKWAGENVVISEVQEMKISGQDFKTFTYQATTPDNPDQEYFGFNAIRIEGNYAMILTLTVNSNQKSDFDEAMKIFTK